MGEELLSWPDKRPEPGSDTSMIFDFLAWEVELEQGDQANKSRDALFYDPFDDESDQGEPFDAAKSFDRIAERYLANEVEHDYTADKFLADAQALTMDAQFMEQFEQLVYIASQMHALCAHDQQLQSVIANTGMFDGFLQDAGNLAAELSAQEHNDDDGHNHSGTKKKSKKTDKESKQAAKSTIKSRGWLVFLWQNMNKKSKKA